MQKKIHTVKEAMKWLNAWKKAKFKCIAPNQVFEAMDFLQSQNRCLNCGRKLKQWRDKYTWKCICMPKDVVLSQG